MSKKKYNKSINANGNVVEEATEEVSTPSEEISVTVKNTESEKIEVTVETGVEEVAEAGIASESDDNSNTAVENEEAHVDVEEEVTTAPEEKEEPEVALAHIQPNGDDYFVKILNDSKKDELIKSRLEKAGIQFTVVADTIIAGPCKSYDDAIALKKKIAGSGLRCTIR